MTATLVDTRLAKVDPEFLTEEYLEALKRRERLRESSAILQTLAAAAEADQTAAAAAVADGEAEALDWLLAASTQVLAAHSAARLIEPPTLDLEVVRVPMNRAGSALMVAKGVFDVEPLSASTEIGIWRNWCHTRRQLPDAPIVSDEERWLLGEIEDFAKRAKTWQTTCDAWFETAKPDRSPEVLDLLATASELVAQALTFVDDASALTDRILIANLERRELGRTWTPPR